MQFLASRTTVTIGQEPTSPSSAPAKPSPGSILRLKGLYLTLRRVIISPMAKDKGKPSTNWLSLRKQLASEKKPSKPSKHTTLDDKHSRKRRKLETSNSVATTTVPASSVQTAGESSKSAGTKAESSKNGISILSMQQMTLGQLQYTDAQKQPGKYLALDCEMVGVGIDGAESSLARVSLVNFYGYVILDEYVQQKERVVDYRTQWSGIRETDMIKAKPFAEVQKRVADLLQDRILVGHAVHNDLKALLLSHPRPQTRDTQIYAYKCGTVKNKRVALRNLVKQELDLTIQSGEHSSITDARATMAVYKLNKKEWEKGSRPLPQSTKSVPASSNSATTSPAPSKAVKRSHSEVDFASDSDSDSPSSDDSDDDDAASEEEPKSMAPQPSVTGTSTKLKGKQQGKAKAKGKDRPTTATTFPGGGRKGVSSGLSTVVRRGSTGGAAVKSRSSIGMAAVGSSGSGGDWWKQLPGGMGGGTKGSVKVSVRR